MLIALGAARGGFASDRRFACERDPEPAPPDPVEAARARGYADGHAAAQAEAAAQAQADAAAREKIESALGAMDKAAVRRFSDRLRATVLALCTRVLGDAAAEPEGLARRVAAAAALFARAHDARVIRLHPEDLLLVETRLPDDWHCEPDPALERGALRIETAEGGVEDAPADWLRALEATLDAC